MIVLDRDPGSQLAAWGLHVRVGVRKERVEGGEVRVGVCVEGARECVCTLQTWHGAAQSMRRHNTTVSSRVNTYVYASRIPPALVSCYNTAYVPPATLSSSTSDRSYA